jgi:TetR/AcrR family transcriptional repressor of nem operon
MEKPSTRLKMINTAIDLFHRQGVNATSVDQILEKSGTGKGQFTHYFKNKDGLVKASITYLSELIQSGNVPTVYQVRTWREMDRWFQSFIDFQKSVSNERSCPIGTIVNDLSNNQNDLRAEIVLFLEWSRNELARFFHGKKQSGELIASAKPEALADFCISIMQGGMLLTKMKRNTDMFENAAAQARKYIKSLRAD